MANVVVFINGPDDSGISLGKINLNQKNKQFTSRVLPIKVGETVTFTNEDEFYHNVWSLSAAKSFDLGQYKMSESKTVTFDKPGIVKVFCNIHPEMISTILVLKNSKFAVTDNDGYFKISDVPPGIVEVRVWTEGAKILSKKITLTKEPLLNLSMEIKVNKVTVEHLNKEGKPYTSY
jgi:plastocyanin